MEDNLPNWSHHRLTYEYFTSIMPTSFLLQEAGATLADASKMDLISTMVHLESGNSWTDPEANFRIVIILQKKKVVS